MMKDQIFWCLSVSLILILFNLLISPSPAFAQMPDVCQEPENILPNCDFSAGLDGWQNYLESGGANFSVLQGGGECHAPLCPAAFIVTEGSFVGGLYRQVPVQAGNTYYANVIWLVFDSLANDAGVNGTVGGIGRRIGIDPTGGTDSRSPNVVWSEDNWRNDCKICGVEHVTVTAQADVVTVFLRIDDTWRDRAAAQGFAIPPSKDQFWIDDIGMKQVSEGEAPAPQPTEEPTPVPAPTEEPQLPDNSTASQSTEEDEAQLAGVTSANSDVASEAESSPEVAEESDTDVEDTEVTDDAESQSDQSGEVADASVDDASIVETATDEPEVQTEQEDTASLAELPTVAPLPTLTPTHTPEPTATAIAQLRPTPIIAQPIARQHAEPEQAQAGFEISAELLGVASTTVCFGGIFVVVMAVALIGGAWLYRAGWGDDDDDFETYDGYYGTADVEIIE